MAINRVDYPANLTAQADFSAHGELIETRFMDQVNAPQWVVSGNIPQGVVLQIGGVVYRGDSDTAITGTASDYVKITPDGATASAAYVPDLTGVTWSAQYNGYYDASENLYLFDEGKALAAGEISAVFGRYLMQQPNGDVTVGGTLGVTGIITDKNGEEVLSLRTETKFFSFNSGTEPGVTDATAVMDNPIKGVAHTVCTLITNLGSSGAGLMRDMSISGNTFTFSAQSGNQNNTWQLLLTTFY